MKIPEFGTLQMTRTDPAHFGTGSLQNINSLTSANINNTATKYSNSLSVDVSSNQIQLRN